ncbi:hypothetical protein BDL97_01G018400 [Sphagnum fallax]|nr:hypothetical protein BDL97_01G018400 [Sphagnum fallax]
MLKKGPPSPTHIISFVIFCFIHPSKDNKTNSCIPNFIEGDSKASCKCWGPLVHLVIEKNKKKKKVMVPQNQNRHEILELFYVNCGCQIHSTIVCHIQNLSFCVCYILVFHMY